MRTVQCHFIERQARPVPSSDDVELECVFTNQWMSFRHPSAYPLIIASDSGHYSIHPSSAMKVVAEVGSRCLRPVFMQQRILTNLFPIARLVSNKDCCQS